MAGAVLHLSSLVGSSLLDSAGERLGRVEDLIARLDAGDQLPSVTGLKVADRRARAVRAGRPDRAARARRGAHVDDEAQPRASSADPARCCLRGCPRPQHRSTSSTARLVSAHEVELIERRRLVAGGRGSTRQSAPGCGVCCRGAFAATSVSIAEFVAWSDIEPFVGHVPTSRLRLAPRRLARLHPAQIADLVEAASHDEGEEIMQAVGQDNELEADVFEELDDEHQVEFLSERPDAEVAAVLARMASDDAADLLLEIDQDRRIPVLNLLPAAKQRKIKRLLGYNPSTAGGLMNPDFASLRGDATVAQAREYVRHSELAPGQLLAIW